LALSLSAGLRVEVAEFRTKSTASENPRKNSVGCGTMVMRFHESWE
jgi:hypothetical protein